jgi:hypothetical protein
MIVCGNSVNAKSFFDIAADLLAQLYGRWLDEKDHEDIEDYMSALLEAASAAGVVLQNMTKRPFGAVFTCDGRTYHMTIKKNTAQYKRIA